MAITATDVKSPAGDIDGAIWFPSLSSGAVDTSLAGYITDAEGQAADNESAQKLWVYYRAATAVADRMASEAASKSLNLVDQGSKSTTFTSSQIQYWIDKAAAYLAAFEDATAPEDTTDALGGWSVLRSLRHA